MSKHGSCVRLFSRGARRGECRMSAFAPFLRCSYLLYFLVSLVKPRLFVL